MSGQPDRKWLSLFFAKVEVRDGHWMWTAATHDGYGMFWGKQAHRVAYNWFVGRVPSGMELHHTCRTPACVNPSHLEPITRKEHHAKNAGVFANRTVCNRRGHALTPDNVGRQWVRNKYVNVCLACVAISNAKRSARNEWDRLVDRQVRHA